MLDVCTTATPIGNFDRSIDDRGIITGTGLHWFQVCFNYIPHVLFHRYHIRLCRINGRGLEMMTEHPIDALYEQFKDLYGKKSNVDHTTNWGTFAHLSITPSDEQKILEMFDYCEEIKPIAPPNYIATFDENGFLTGTNAHWFQLVFEHLMHIILIDEWKWQYNMCLMTLTNLLTGPVEYLYDKYQRKLNKASYFDSIELDYVRENQERENRRIEREKAKKLKEKSAK